MAEQSSNTSRNILVGLGVLLALAAAIYFVRFSGHDALEVRAAGATHADMISSVSTNGKVEPVEDFQAHAPGPGVISRVFVQLGSHVGQGAELLLMDASDARKNILTAQAAVQSAQAALANLKNNGTQEENLAASADLASARTAQQQAATALASVQALQARGAASANEVTTATQRLADAQARVSQLEARRKGRYSSGDIAAQQAQVAQAQAGLSAARTAYASVDIRAPFAGTVYSLPVATTDYVQGGEALLNMADLNRMQVRAYFDEPEIGKLAAGQPVKIVWDAKPNTSWHGHIRQAPTTVITYGTRNVGECLISVDDSKGDLLPNTNVTVTVTTAEKKGVLSVPREALRTEGMHNYVYRIVDQQLKKSSVQVGSVNNTRVEVDSGVADGDIVALAAVNNVELKEGAKVKVAQ